MKGFWKYFWKLYTLFFAIPFPMLLYYNIDDGSIRQPGVGTNPWLAMTYLLVAIILWGWLLQDYFRAWVILPYKMRNNLRNLLKSGTRKDARIIKRRVLQGEVHGAVPLELTLRFHNFSGTEIDDDIQMYDSRPEEMRYEEGRTANVLIDETLKSRPLMVLEGASVSMKPVRIVLLLLAWMVIAALVAGYFWFSYIMENSGKGWRFMVFYHPLVLCPLILLAIDAGWRLLMRLFAVNPEQLLELKYFGVRTDAQIISAKETGTYINEQPQIRFELRYQDNNGVTHMATLKRVISLLDLDITKRASVPVFYLKGKPAEVSFASDFES